MGIYNFFIFLFLYVQLLRHFTCFPPKVSFFPCKYLRNPNSKRKKSQQADGLLAGTMIC